MDTPPPDQTRSPEALAAREAPGAGLFLCQFNIALLKYPFHSREMFAFRERVLSVHEEAEKAPGWIGQVSGIETAEGFLMPWPEQPRLMGNLTAWTDPMSLWSFTFQNVEHLDVMRRKRDWFDPLPVALRPYNVLYWSNVICLEEAKDRLAHLHQHGPTPLAFTWKEVAQCES